MQNGIHGRKHYKPSKKINFAAILLIAVGALLIFFYTPPWVWCILLGMGLILAGVFSLKKWR